MGDTDADGIGRHEGGEAVGPFDDDEAVGGFEFVVGCVPDVFRGAGAVEVEVEDGTARGKVFVDERESGAGGEFRATPTFDQAADKVGLARAEFAGEGDARTGGEGRGEGASGGDGFFRRTGFDGGHGRARYSTVGGGGPMHACLCVAGF